MPGANQPQPAPDDQPNGTSDTSADDLRTRERGDSGEGIIIAPPIPDGESVLCVADGSKWVDPKKKS